jgi:CheY-like chemotaxis protein
MGLDRFGRRRVCRGERAVASGSLLSRILVKMNDKARMTRPCFLVVDREFAGSISTRKLVLETAKFNVITAYSGMEALETLRKFPALSGAVIDSNIEDVRCGELVRELKILRPDLPVIVVAPPGFEDCPGADHVLESFEPAKLLETLKSLVPKETAAIEKRNEDLSREEWG